MRRLFGLAMVAAVLAAAFAGGCSDSSGPSGSEQDEYPAIPGLVAFYQFDGNLADSGPNGHDAAGGDGLVYVDDHNGVASSAVFVSGRTDTIIVANRGAFDFEGAFTVAGWMMADLETYAYCCVVDKGYAAGGWAVGTSGTETPSMQALRFYVANHSHDFYVTDAVPVGQDTWVHFACSFNDTTDVARLYVDGAFARADTYTVDMTASGLDLYIGTSHWRDAYNGALDQIALFDRVLSDAEVLDLYDFD